MPTSDNGSARRRELLELAYRYVLDNGLADLSLRPLAAAIGSSPRVLLFLFDSKDGLTRALLDRAREDELALLDAVRASGPGGLAEVGRAIWDWLAAVEHRGLLVLWTESFARSLLEADGVWAGFAHATVADWLSLLAETQPPRLRRTAAGAAQRTLVLAVLRGALLDLLATGDRRRATAAVDLTLQGLGG